MTKIRVGILSRFPITDIDAMSGTPARAFRALQDAGFDTVDLSAYLSNGYSFKPSLYQRAMRKLCKKIKKYLVKFESSEQEYSRKIREVISLSSRAQEEIEKNNVDVIVGVCISSMLYSINTEKPIIYASDTTARSINETYPEWKAKSEGYKRACDQIEKQALNKCAYFLPAAKVAAESAINDYDMPADRVRLIEFGAHVVPSSPPGKLSSPSKNNIQLSLVASDPIRKRLGFCIDVVECLAKRGWNAKLNYIGSNSALAKDHPLVNSYGRLKLSCSEDRKIHEQVMTNSHWMILPSKAEAFGIAPGEAAHFGRPSIVSAAGGLPTVVHHGVTGIVMPLDADAESYATALIAASENPEAYQHIAKAALDRATNCLNWDTWGRRVGQLITELVAQKNPA